MNVHPTHAPIKNVVLFFKNLLSHTFKNRALNSARFERTFKDFNKGICNYIHFIKVIKVPCLNLCLINHNFCQI